MISEDEIVLNHEIKKKKKKKQAMNFREGWPGDGSTAGTL